MKPQHSTNFYKIFKCFLSQKTIFINCFLIIIFLNLFQNVFAQFSQDFESISCNRGNLAPPNDCWVFSAFNTLSSGINGCSVQSGSLSNPVANIFLQTPALNIAATSVVSFNYRATNTTSAPSFTVTAEDVSTNVETPIWLQANPLPTATTAVSFTFPSAPGAGNYRIVFKPSGNGGSSRVQIDDINITNASQIETYSSSTGTCNVVILPLTLISFNGSNASLGTNLYWKVAQENMSGYQVQVSEDGIAFNTLTTIPARNSLSIAEYFYLDKNNYFSNTCYYRLKLIEPTGAINYSNVIVVKNSKKLNTVIITPNPTKNFINIIFKALTTNDNAQLALLTLEGKMLLQRAINVINQPLSINVSNFPSGKYIVRIITSTEVINKIVYVLR